VPGFNSSSNNIQALEQHRSKWNSQNSPATCSRYGSRRFRHHLSTSATCLSCPEDEDIDHLLLLCPHAQEVWLFFHNNFGSRGITRFTDIWLAQDHSYEEASINTAIAWTIWKRRNALAFDGIVEDLSLVSRRCIEDVRLWAYRCNTPSSSDALNFWCNNYDPP
jgi:hypothetical protein